MNAQLIALILAMALISCGKISLFSKSKPSSANNFPSIDDPVAAKWLRNPNEAICEIAPSHPRSNPTWTVKTCIWQSNCQDGGTIQLETNLVADTIRVISQSDGKIYNANYDLSSGSITFLTLDCPARGATLVVQYAKNFNQPAQSPDSVATNIKVTSSNPTPKSPNEFSLYANPCRANPLTNDLCPPGIAYLDLKSSVPSCQNLNLELGDTCPERLEKCEHSPAQACANRPNVTVRSAGYFYCRSEPFAENECAQLSHAYDTKNHKIPNATP